ncbi:hypothetical protein INR49_028145 [Caranx melampygus]|nr:hypothetical protein INR49_028145 [Caranx melampygus]
MVGCGSAGLWESSRRRGERLKIAEETCCDIQARSRPQYYTTVCNLSCLCSPYIRVGLSINPMCLCPHHLCYDLLLYLSCLSPLFLFTTTLNQRLVSKWELA